MMSCLTHSANGFLPAAAVRHPRRVGLLRVIALLLLVVGIHAPFLNQAFHMDDGLYLTLAHNVQHNCWSPQDMPTLFEGLSAADLASTEHPWPLTPYVLAFCTYFGGRSEIWMHLGFLVFPIVLSLSMYSIAARITRHPFLAVLTLLSMPVVYVMSHNLMTDIPLLSLWLASVAIFQNGVASRRISLIWIGAAVSSIALLLSYAGLCLILLLALYGILRRDRAATAIALFVPASVFGIWMAVTFFHYRRVAPGLLIGSYLFAKRVLSPELLAQKSASIVLCLGGVTIFPLVLLSIGKRRSVAIGGVLALASGLIFGRYVSGPWQRAMLIFFFGAGFAAISEVVGIMAASLASFRSHWNEVAEDLFLSIWFAVVLVFCVVVYMTGSARYILPALPPLVLILFRRVQISTDEKKLFPLSAANVVLSGSLAFSLALADYQFAGMYREFASSLKACLPGHAKKLWFAGEWGLRAYLEQLGGHELGRRDARPRVGDLLVVPRLATPYQTLYSETVGFESIVMVAPSHLTFDIPALPPGSVLACTIGMPFHARSDGLDFSLHFRSRSDDRILHQERVTPVAGCRWQVREISLAGIAGESGAIVFASEVGNSGNAEADWLAVTRARIQRQEAEQEIVVYDFANHLNNARIESVPGIQYHTERNRPVFTMRAWLEQEPATILRARYKYNPTFPFRLLDEQSHAGFWGSSWGLLPFSFVPAKSVLECISVYEVIRSVGAYGETTPAWYER